MIRMQNFNPNQNITLNCTTTSAGANITQNFTTSNSSPLTDIRIANSGTSVAFVNWAGGTGVTATTTTGVAILAGAVESFNMGVAAQSVAAIMSAGTANVYVSIGEGS